MVGMVSFITEILIQGAAQRDIDGINAWLLEHDTERQQQLQPVDISDQAGGTKFYVEKMWAAAINYAPPELLDVLKNPETWSVWGVKWTYDCQGGSVVVGLCAEDEVRVVEFEW